MQTKMTHSEFIDFCKSKGIKANKISRNFVYVDMDLTQVGSNLNNNLSRNIVIPALSNCRTDIYNGPIYPTIGICDHTTTYSKVYFKDAIGKGQIINAIKILRSHFNLGLKEAKDLYDFNIESWKNEVSKFWD